MSKVIEARAIISATDNTGTVFDRIAKKINGMTTAATAFQGIKAPQGGGGLIGLGQKGWGAQFQKEIDTMALSSRQLGKVRRDWEDFHGAMAKGPVRFANYTRAIDEWKNSTLSNLKEVHAGMAEHEKRRKRFFDGMNSGLTRAGGGLRAGAEMALAAGGVGGAVYMGARGIEAGAKAAGDRAREMARYSLGGLSDQEKQEAMTKADEVSSKYPSISRTEVLGHIRQLRSRLGSFDHAIDNTETLTKAQVVLATLGHGGEGADQDLEQLVLGLESQGLGNNPEKFKSYMNAFVKAKSLFPDLRGEDFRLYMKNANASKYGLSDDYLQNVAPTMMQHEGSSNFGTMQASAFSALIGGHQTKPSKAIMASYGLTEDKAGKHIKKMDMLISNPYKWATEFLAPQLEGKGVRLDEEHRGDVVKAVTQMFSNRKVGEFFTSMLVNRGIIEKDRELLKYAHGTEGADISRSQDPYVALSGLTNQMKDTAAAFIGMKPVINAMNAAATSFSNMAHTFQTGEVPKNTNLGKIIAGVNTPVEDINEQHRRENLEAQQREIEGKLTNDQGGFFGLSDEQTKKLRLRSFELRSGIDASNNASTMPPIFSDAERAQWEEIDREHRRGKALSELSGGGGGPHIPLPMADPRKTFSEMPPVQSLEGATVQATLNGSAEVTGQVTVKSEITASSTLLSIVQAAQDVVAKLQGTLSANGPGSLGHSSPDAAAPARYTGPPAQGLD
jgi:hypothetical protein